MLSFVIAEEDLRIETSYPFNKVTGVFLLNNSRFHHTSHSDEPYQIVHVRMNITLRYTHTTAGHFISYLPHMS